MTAVLPTVWFVWNDAIETVDVSDGGRAAGDPPGVLVSALLDCRLS